MPYLAEWLKNTSCYHLGVSHFVKNIHLMLGNFFVNNREEVLFLSGGKISLAKILDISCLCKFSNIAVIVAGEQNSSAEQQISSGR